MLLAWRWRRHQYVRGGYLYKFRSIYLQRDVWSRTRTFFRYRNCGVCHMGYVFWQQIFVSPDAQTYIQEYMQIRISHMCALKSLNYYVALRRIATRDTAYVTTYSTTKCYIRLFYSNTLYCKNDETRRAICVVSSFSEYDV